MNLRIFIIIFLSLNSLLLTSCGMTKSIAFITIEGTIEDPSMAPLASGQVCATYVHNNCRGGRNDRTVVDCDTFSTNDQGHFSAEVKIIARSGCRDYSVFKTVHFYTVLDKSRVRYDSEMGLMNYCPTSKHGATPHFRTSICNDNFTLNFSSPTSNEKKKAKGGPSIEDSLDFSPEQALVSKNNQLLDEWRQRSNEWKLVISQTVRQTITGQQSSFSEDHLSKFNQWIEDAEKGTAFVSSEAVWLAVDPGLLPTVSSGTNFFLRFEKTLDESSTWKISLD